MSSANVDETFEQTEAADVSIQITKAWDDFRMLLQHLLA